MKGLRPRLVRIGRALSTLRDRLVQSGFRFEDPDGVLPGPDPGVDEALREIERVAGRVPKAYAEFQRIVGPVNFMGEPESDWAGCDYPDPIVVYPLQAVLEELEFFGEDPGWWEDCCGGFRIPIAPDSCHKANVSGGMWYGLAVPAEDDDPPLLEEPHGIRFLEYLELAIRWGGFPGLDGLEGPHTWPIAELTRGLLPRGATGTRRRRGAR